ncbi:hypothetical protein [Rhizobium leguminosarum]|uniref:hypothetical protein n=1 Tax=Rhizobium leguminosarum TaxID=384 RepID=UPI001AE9D1D8|nr:hypothetical protein [Rhizobium leguminosarum]MBP2443806.1 hypothetical protein [Rhizobium leguminosarum]
MAARKYDNLWKLDVVLRRIEPKSFSELNVYSPKHSTPRRRVYFNFAICAELGPLAPRFASEFVIWMADLVVATARGKLVPVRYWMRHLAHADAAYPEDWTPTQWQFHTTEWWLSIRSDPDLKDVTKNEYLYHVQNFIAHLQQRQVIPRFKLPKAIRGAKGRKKITVAEVLKQNKENPKDDLLPEDVKSALAELDFLDDLTDSAQVLRRIEIILDATRSFLESKIRSFWTEWTATRQYLDLGVFDPEDFLEKFAVSRDPLKLRRGWREVIDSRARIIALVEYMHGSMLPVSTSDPVLRLVYNEYSVGEIRDLMHSTPDSVLPFLALVLVNDPIEVSSASNLFATSLKTTSNPSNVRLTYLKKRARYRKINVIWAASDERTLKLASRRRIEPATALGCILQMREPLQHYAEPADADRLFLVCGNKGHGETVKVLSPPILRAAWDRLRQEDPILSRYRYTLDKLRPTLILRSFLVSGGDIFATFHAARHKWLTTTQSYVNEVVTEKMSSSAAREVQDVMTLSVTKDRPHLEKSAGISPVRARAIIEKARHMGFLEHTGGQSRKKVTEDLVKFTQGEVIVIEDASVAAEILVFKEHLVSELPILRTSSDFESVWLPLLVYVNGCLAALPPDVLERGRKLASELQIAYLDAPHA